MKHPTHFAELITEFVPCDSCRARSGVEVTWQTEDDHVHMLTFCFHHYRVFCKAIDEDLDQWLR